MLGSKVEGAGTAKLPYALEVGGGVVQDGNVVRIEASRGKEWRLSFGDVALSQQGGGVRGLIAGVQGIELDGLLRLLHGSTTILLIVRELCIQQERLGGTSQRIGVTGLIPQRGGVQPSGVRQVHLIQLVAGEESSPLRLEFLPRQV
ncbi:hypothetical protein [Deinococcus yavapaiensis]|uniref:hypothetical protein n=1 Tax=Deinococcus yavapaiensis TaxID=309889 RepID=UPI000DA18A53|nr:hypothetical protein [Deinococcus yavapaiensis]